MRQNTTYLAIPISMWHETERTRLNHLRDLDIIVMYHITNSGHYLSDEKFEQNQICGHDTRNYIITVQST